MYTANTAITAARPAPLHSHEWPHGGGSLQLTGIYLLLTLFLPCLGFSSYQHDAIH